MRRLVKLVAVFVLLSILSGCASPMAVGLRKSAQHYVPSGDLNKGCIYIYREKSYMGCIRGVYVTANGERIGALNNGTYFVHESDPGDVVISVENWLGDDPSRRVRVEAGKRYYLRGSIRMGLLDLAPYIERVAEIEGEGAIESLTYATLKEKR